MFKTLGAYSYGVVADLHRLPDTRFPLTIRAPDDEVNEEITGVARGGAFARARDTTMQMRGAGRMRARESWRRSGGALMLAVLFLLCSTGVGAAQERAHRIVSTAPSLTEALFALALGPEVVGVSQYCEWPAAVKSLPKVGTYAQPSVEAILRLHPDLVLLEQASTEVANRLQAVGVRFVDVPHGSLAETFAGIEVIARAAGVPERGAALVLKMRGQLHTIAVRSEGRPKVRVLVVVDRRQGMLADLYAVGPGSYLNELIETAGGVNVLARPGVPPWPKISLETVLREDPDVIVDLSDAHDTDAPHSAARATDTSMWERETGLKAARSKHIYLADSPVFVVPGPRSIDAAEKMFEYLHQGGGRQ